jgi:hypothetical protein
MLVICSYLNQGEELGWLHKLTHAISLSVIASDTVSGWCCQGESKYMYPKWLGEGANFTPSIACGSRVGRDHDPKKIKHQPSTTVLLFAQYHRWRDYRSEYFRNFLWSSPLGNARAGIVTSSTIILKLIFFPFSGLCLDGSNDSACLRRTYWVILLAWILTSLIMSNWSEWRSKKLPNNTGRG